MNEDVFSANIQVQYEVMNDTGKGENSQLLHWLLPVGLDLHKERIRRRRKTLWYLLSSSSIIICLSKRRETILCQKWQGILYPITILASNNLIISPKIKLSITTDSFACSFIIAKVKTRSYCIGCFQLGLTFIRRGYAGAGKPCGIFSVHFQSSFVSLKKSNYIMSEMARHSLSYHYPSKQQLDHLNNVNVQINIICTVNGHFCIDAVFSESM
eukprot:scaffold7929_cov210-Skeletonema_marinoi.AAC.1